MIASLCRDAFGGEFEVEVLVVSEFEVEGRSRWVTPDGCPPRSAVLAVDVLRFGSFLFLLCLLEYSPMQCFYWLLILMPLIILLHRRLFRIGCL